MKRALLLAALPLFGCSSLLGLDDFSDAPGSGGAAGGGSGGAAGGGSGGTSGAGGAPVGGAGGTGGSKWKCTDDAAGPLTLLTPTDLYPFAAQPDRLVAVASQGMGHVGINATDQANGKSRFFVRTLRDSTADPLGGTAWYEGPYARMLDGLGMANKSVVFFGTLGFDSLSRITFPLDPSMGVKPGANADAVPTTYTPPECAGGAIDHVAYNVALGAGTTPAFACVKSGVATLWLTLNGVLTKVAETSNQADFEQLAPSAYSVVGNTHLIMTKQGSFRFGTTVADLQLVHQLAPTANSGWLTGALFAVPTMDTVPSTAVAVGAFKSDLTAGELFAGTIATAKYGDLAKTPIPGLVSSAKVTSPAQLSNAERRSVTANAIVMAGVSFAQDAVRFTLATRAGEVRLFNQEIYKPAAGKLVLHAAATQVGPYYAVAWLEKDKSSGDVVVRAKRLVCGE